MKIRRRCENSCSQQLTVISLQMGANSAKKARVRERRAVEGDLYLLQQFGPFLDQRIGEQTLRDYLIHRIAENSSQEGWNQVAAI